MGNINSVSLFGNSYGSTTVKKNAPEEQNLFSKAPLNFHAYENTKADDTSKKSKNAYLDLYM